MHFLLTVKIVQIELKNKQANVVNSQSPTLCPLKVRKYAASVSLISAPASSLGPVKAITSGTSPVAIHHKMAYFASHKHCELYMKLLQP